MGQETSENSPNSEILQMTTKVVAAYVGNNSVGGDRVPEVIKSVYASLAGLDGHSELRANKKQKPAVPIKKSVYPDYIICLEDGVKMKMLKRRLRTTFGLTPEEYRAKWSLPADYPMTAPNYAKWRSNFAKEIGLGKQRS